MKQHTIQAHFKVEVFDGIHLFDSLEDFEAIGGTVGVYRAPNAPDKLDYQITVRRLGKSTVDGYHLMEATGMQDDPPQFFPWLIIKRAGGGLSYHYPMRPDAGDGRVYLS